jgi:tetratricopeptide (TPR) repeat protein
MTPLRRLGLLAAAVLLAAAIGATPLHAMGGDENPSQPPTTPSDGSKKGKKGKKNAIEQQQQQEADARFQRGYNAARIVILAGDYRDGIARMHALGRDDHPDVANYIGYAYRKLGNYEQSRIWYEAALKADPNHARTWSYYGMWQAEQGNRLKAMDFLQKVNLICGSTDCREYIELRGVIDGTASY